MDLTQIGLGLGLLAISGLTFAGPAALDPPLVSLLTGTALVAGTGAVLTTVAREA
ncbi:hypothetical protein [Halopiger aswanensis]|uniref:Uncharacterized protein n=1 Tax=Halopiger aswanensis TaxID=148449 RepID=A0A419WJR4_9EURY|nr:hypothetical protein [Halopiger aswanensis]RKD95703.1 hypothetical protein ATJ93_2565 [Halopiger aswanensis]